MKKKKILHVLAPDKFTIPFIHLINKEFDPEDHIFLCNSKPEDELLLSYSNVTYLLNPYKRNLIRNTVLFYTNIRNASKIILHGNPVLFYFFIFPGILKKTYWFIHGYEIAEIALGNIEVGLYNLNSFIKKFVLKRVRGHVTHIKGDSELANNHFKSHAEFFYSPLYLSNVVTKIHQAKRNENSKQEIKKILVGNSTSPTNNHLSILEMLLPYKDSDIIIYCPLSYGIYDDYRDNIIMTGKKLFGEKFIPLTKFIEIEKYRTFLETVDIGIFNHLRQEAMGTTLQLMNLGKVVYMNKSTTSYESFVMRGFRVFDNSLIGQGGLFEIRDVKINPGLINKYYSHEVFIRTLTTVFNDTPAYKMKYSLGRQI